MQNTKSIAAKPSTTDAGRVRLGAALKRAAAPSAPSAPQPVRDTGRVRLGAALKRG